MWFIYLYSLVAPVQPDGDVSLDVPALVLRQVTGQQLPPQVDELQHHVADLVEQIDFVFLVEREGRDGVSVWLQQTFSSCECAADYSRGRAGSRGSRRVEGRAHGFLP